MNKKSVFRQKYCRVMTLAICIIRTILLYILVIAAMRIMGKRQVGELQPTDLVITILISELASVPMQDFGIPILYGIIPILTLICAEILTSFLCIKSVRLRNLLSGHTISIIKNGVVQQRNMREMRLSTDDLMREMRIHNVSSLSDVAYAQMETNGHMTVILKPDFAPSTAGMIGVHPSPTGYPVVLISDGRLINENLSLCEKTLDWLLEQLKEHGVSFIRDVFLFTLDDFGNTAFIPKEMSK